MKKKIAVILCGSGNRDGSEIHESVFAMHALQSSGVEALCFAPDGLQTLEVNHLSGRTLSESHRNMLEESARIARGKILPLADLEPSEIDGMVLPGGFGAAYNLCTFAKHGAAKMTVIPELEAPILSLFQNRRPLGGICIAPVILAKVLNGHGITLTLGDEHCEAAQEIRQNFDAKILPCPAGQFIADPQHRIFTTPAYMYAQSSMCEVQHGILAMVQALVATL